jgi:hypothetical protein
MTGNESKAMNSVLREYGIPNLCSKSHIPSIIPRVNGERKAKVTRAGT